jgi:hypothetical protein
LLLLRISGRGSRKANHGQCERKRDHLLHRGTPVRTGTAARVVIGKRTAFNLVHRGAWPKWYVFPIDSSRSSPRTRPVARLTWGGARGSV